MIYKRIHIKKITQNLSVSPSYQTNSNQKTQREIGLGTNAIIKTSYLMCFCRIEVD